MVKNPPWVCRRHELTPGSGRSPGGRNGNLLHILAWEIPWTEEPGRSQTMGRQKSWTQPQTELSDQIRSVPLSCPTLCDPMNCSTPGLLVHHQLPEFTQTHVHRVSDAIQPSHPLSSPSPLAPNPSQHQGLFQ